MGQSFRILVLPSLLTLAVLAVALMGAMSYQTQRSRETTYFVRSIQQARPCTLCHDGSFARSSLRVATRPCAARPPAN